MKPLRGGSSGRLRLVPMKPETAALRNFQTVSKPTMQLKKHESSLIFTNQREQKGLRCDFRGHRTGRTFLASNRGKQSASLVKMSADECFLSANQLHRSGQVGTMQKTFNAKTPGREGAMASQCLGSQFKELHLVAISQNPLICGLSVLFPCDLATSRLCVQFRLHRSLSGGLVWEPAAGRDAPRAAG